MPRNKGDNTPKVNPREDVPGSALIRAPDAGNRVWTAERLRADEPPPYFEELKSVWFQLQGPWNWLIVSPAGADYSSAPFAHALARVGARLSVHPVEFIEANGLDVDSAARLFARLGPSNLSRGPSGGDAFVNDSWAPPILKTIVALESPLSNWFTLPLSLASDGVVLCVRRGRDRVENLRSTVRAFGADRIVCCVLTR
jgi:hypothetical protein